MGLDLLFVLNTFILNTLGRGYSIINRSPRNYPQVLGYMKCHGEMSQVLLLDKPDNPWSLSFISSRRLIKLAKNLRLIINTLFLN